MDPYSRVLYGGFPRDMGIPRRFTVFSRGRFDRVVEKANQHHNVYSSISRLPPTGPEGDKVFFDLDSDVKAEGMTESEQFELMRDDPDVAEEVLGDVVDDMHTLVRLSKEDGIPVVGLFSGMGIHVHQLYQTARNHHDEIKSIGRKYIDEGGLITYDPKVFEPIRLSKIPNTKRWEKTDDPSEEMQFTGVWTVPLKQEEMLEATPQDLLEWSQGPRDDLNLSVRLVNERLRPKMEVYDDYLGANSITLEQKSMGEEVDTSGKAADIVKEFIDIPCVRERVLTKNPDHKIRMNFAVLMFNYGFTRSEVHEIIRELGWKDYDRQTTKQQLDNIWNKKYADMSCSKLMSEGWCTRRENPKSCATYGWAGGNNTY